MVLNELTAVPSLDLPIAELSEHLHLGTGFSDDGSLNPVLENYLRAALATVEARTGKALFERRFQMIVYQWANRDAHGLPIAPVQQIESLKTVTRAGVEAIIDQDAYGLILDSQRPRIAASGGQLASIPSGGHAELVLLAGYAAQWSGIPNDLRQAVLLTAAYYYEHRAGPADGTTLPAPVLALIDGYRSLRLSGRIA